MIEASQEELKEAELLCGDSITNYKTVQSFGHPELIFQMYDKILGPVYDKKKM